MPKSITVAIFAVFATLFVWTGDGQAASHDAKQTATADTFLLTIFLKHDQSKTIAQIRKELEVTGFWRVFPPKGIAVESWKVVMGIGQVVTLRVPASRLREVNLAIEKTAWGAFRTEFYPTYDLWPIVQKIKKEQEGKQ